jgi:hypothetical protein
MGQYIKAPDISYEPLPMEQYVDFIKQKGEEYQGALTLGNQVLSELDFKEGAITEGAASALREEYSNEINSAINELVSNKNSREFSRRLLGIKSKMNADERIKAGEIDYTLTNAFNQAALEGKTHGVWYAALKGHYDDPSGKREFNRLDPDKWNVANVTDLWTRTAPAYDIYQDYNAQMQNLSSIQMSQLRRDPETGQYFKQTTKGPKHYATSGEALKEINPELYQKLVSDYENSVTNTAKHFKTPGRNLDDFIDEVLVQSFPFLQNEILEEVSDPTAPTTKKTKSDSDSPEEPGIILNGVPLATTYLGTGAEGADIDIFENVAGNAAANIIGTSQLLEQAQKELKETGTLSEDSREKLEQVALAQSMIDVFEETPDYSIEGVTGKDLRETATRRVKQLLTDPTLPEFFRQSLTDEQISSYGEQITRYSTSENVRGGSENADRNFLALRNTMALLGYTDFVKFVGEKDNILDFYDTPENAEFAILQGGKGARDGGYLTKEELENTLEDAYTYYRTGNIQEVGSDGVLRKKTEALEKDSPYSILNSKLREYNNLVKTNHKGRQVTDSMLALMTDVDKMDFYRNNPIGFYYAERRRFTKASDYIYTDQYIVFPSQLKETVQGALEVDLGTIKTQGIGSEWGLQLYTPSTDIRTSGGRNELVRVEDDARGSIKPPYTEADEDDVDKFFEYYGKSKGPNSKIKIAATGVIMPEGDYSKTGFVVLVTDNTTSTPQQFQYVLYPQSGDAMETSELLKAFTAARPTLASKTYNTAIAGSAGLNKVAAENVHETFVLTAAANNIQIPSQRAANTRDIITEAGAGSYFPVEDNNPFVQKEANLVKQLSTRGEQIYRILNPENIYEPLTWKEYFPENIPKDSYIGHKDLEVLLSNILIAYPGKLDNVASILRSDYNLNIGQLEQALGLSWEEDIRENLPITLINEVDALSFYSDRNKQGEYAPGIPLRGVFSGK